MAAVKNFEKERLGHPPEYVGSSPVPSSPTREYIYSGSALLATIQGGVTTYHHQDHLSVRVNTNASGTKVGEQGHFPFGESWYSTSTTTKWQFTSYERDSESVLDYAMFRYDNSRLGRFMTPDPVAGSVLDPQSLNRYAYTRNDPVNLSDPLGLRPPRCKFDGELWVCRVDVDEQWKVAQKWWWQVREEMSARRTELLAQYGSERDRDPGHTLGPGPDGVPGGDPMRELQQRQLKALAACLSQLYNISLRTFVPVAPGSNGYFYGRDAGGRAITVETDVSQPSWWLGLAKLPPGPPIAGYTPPSTSRRQTNYVASDFLAANPVAGFLEPTHVHELAHSLDQITSGSIYGSSEESADRLQDCINNKLSPNKP